MYTVAQPGGQQCLHGSALPGRRYVATMKKDDDAAVTVREAVAGLWRKGAALEWSVPQELEEVPGTLRPTSGIWLENINYY